MFGTLQGYLSQTFLVMRGVKDASVSADKDVLLSLERFISFTVMSFTRQKRVRNKLIMKKRKEKRKEKKKDPSKKRQKEEESFSVCCLCLHAVGINRSPFMFDSLLLLLMLMTWLLLLSLP